MAKIQVFCRVGHGIGEWADIIIGGWDQAWSKCSALRCRNDRQSSKLMRALPNDRPRAAHPNSRFGVPSAVVSIRCTKVALRIPSCSCLLILPNPQFSCQELVAFMRRVLRW